MWHIDTSWANITSYPIEYDDKDISRVIRMNYSKNVTVFKTEIPHSIKAAETSSVGKSIFAYDKNGKAAEAYRNLTKEVLENGKQRNKHRSEIIR